MTVREYKHFFGDNREVAIKRDGSQCVKCGMTREEHRQKYNKDITVDHIDMRGKNLPQELKNNDINNLQTLCLPCHGAKSFSDKKMGRSQHGMLSMYTNHKCRCDACRYTWSVYNKQYKKLKKLGTI